MRTKLLLDTCAVLYVTEQKLGAMALKAMDDAFNANTPVSVSAITAWEIGLLSERGRLPTTAPPLRYFEEFVALPGIQLETLTPSVLVESSFLPTPIHRDPADRMIIATARALDLTIVTSDRLILEYASRGHVRALAC
ncbi:MAG: type II toxin-antitoxin system VapC family toxin [Devosia sp.]|nr:type II toxin-antitoxin system VapC family toxin [Devosia sp.]